MGWSGDWRDARGSTALLVATCAGVPLAVLLLLDRAADMVVRVVSGSYLVGYVLTVAGAVAWRMRPRARRRRPRGRRWRPRPASRLGLLALAAFLSYVGFIGIAVDGSWFAGLLFSSLVGVVLLSGFASHVELDADAVRVVNLGWSTSVPLVDVTEVDVGYWGLEIRHRTGHVTATAVRKSNLAAWTGTQTRGDAVVAAISAAVQRRKAERDDAARS